jgi:hypothetical protein
MSCFGAKIKGTNVTALKSVLSSSPDEDALCILKTDDGRRTDHYRNVSIITAMEAVRASETPVNIYLTTQQCIPEDAKLHTRRRENLKSHTDHYCVSARYQGQRLQTRESLGEDIFCALETNCHRGR